MKPLTLFVVLLTLLSASAFASVGDGPAPPAEKGDAGQVTIIVDLPGHSSTPRDVQFVCSEGQTLSNVAMVAEESYAAMYADWEKLVPVEAELITREASYAIALEFMRERKLSESPEGKAYYKLVVDSLDRLQKTVPEFKPGMLMLHGFYLEFYANMSPATPKDQEFCWLFITTPNLTDEFVQVMTDAMTAVHTAGEDFLTVFKPYADELELYKQRRFGKAGLGR